MILCQIPQKVKINKYTTYFKFTALFALMVTYMNTDFNQNNLHIASFNCDLNWQAKNINIHTQ